MAEVCNPVPFKKEEFSFLASVLLDAIRENQSGFREALGLPPKNNGAFELAERMKEHEAILFAETLSQIITEDDKVASIPEVNAAKCLCCGDIIESKHRHDYVSCSCGMCAVDGGHDYQKWTCDDPEMFHRITTRAGLDKLKQKITVDDRR